MFFNTDIMSSMNDIIYDVLVLHIFTWSVAYLSLLAGAVPEDTSFDDDNSDLDHGAPDQHDDADFGGDRGGAGPGPSRAHHRPLDPLALFIQELEDLSSMNGPDILSAVEDLPMPQEGDVSGVSVQVAVAVRCYIIMI